METEREAGADLGQDGQQVLTQDKVVLLPWTQHGSTRPRVLLRRKVLRSSQQSCPSNWCFNTSFPIHELVTILAYRTWVAGYRKPCLCPAPVSPPSLQAACKPGQQCLMNLLSPCVLDSLLENWRAAKETNVSCCLWMTWVSWHLADNCGTHSQNSSESGNPPSSTSFCCFPRRNKKPQTFEQGNSKWEARDLY